MTPVCHRRDDRLHAPRQVVPSVLVHPWLVWSAPLILRTELPGRPVLPSVRILPTFLDVELLGRPVPS